MSQLDRLLSEQEVKLSALYALVLMVEGGSGEDQITDSIAWLHTQFHLYRSTLTNNDPRLHRLFQIEFQFVEAISAMSLDAQSRQLRKALAAMREFHWGEAD